MATIHLAGSIALFLFGGGAVVHAIWDILPYATITTTGAVGLDILILPIGVLMIGAGVFVAKMSKN